MTTPHPTAKQTASRRARIHGSAEVYGPLVRQPAPAARLAHILHNSAEDLWDACTLTDTKHMQIEAAAIARRILASCQEPKR